MPRARKETTPVTVENPIYAARIANLGEFSVAYESIGGGGIDPAPAFRGLPDDRCPCPHWGLVVSGRVTMRYSDREETWEAGDAFYMPPGHIPLAHDDALELITFSPTKQLQQVMAVIAKNQAEMAAALEAGAAAERQ